VVILSAFCRPRNVVRAIRLGAEDFIEKPYTLTNLCTIIERALMPVPVQDYADVREAGDDHNDGNEGNTGFEGCNGGKKKGEAADTHSSTPRHRHRKDPSDPLHRFVGSSKRVSLMKSLIRTFAPSPEPVLLIGESGTGKELLARAIHELSPRRKGPYYVQHAGAIPETLIESELYGSTAGAYTGATSRPGYFEKAHGGTLFLDEIGEMPLSAQMKLLRILEEPAIMRIGGRRKVSIDVRVVCATNRPIHRMVAGEWFRLDLYHRINTLTISIPSLRERMEDVLELALHFFDEEGVPESRIRRGSLDRLLDYHWPGNTRELKNTVKRAAILASGGPVEPKHIYFSEDLSA
jgi:DNA-binding NtrC family response regulator